MSLATSITCQGQTFHMPKSKSFDSVSSVAETIVEQMLIRYLAKDLDGSNAFQAAYYEFLFLCGWTEKRYDSEMLERIDRAW